MTDTFRPETEAQVIDALSWANSSHTPLEVLSLGTKRALGRPLQTAHSLDMSAFSGIALYEPEELVLAAGPATPLAEIEQTLADNQQQLAFEPPDLSGLLGSESSGTIGGVISCNLAGPRRIKDGAARDHFLGFDAVSGRGQAVKSGGRVMKNVTGYDLSKLLCGSFGTLAAMTRLTLKVLPVGQKTRTVLVRGVTMQNAASVLAKGLNGPFEVSGAAWLPASISARSTIGYIKDAACDVAALRLEGFGPSVDYRTEKLRALLAADGETEELHSHNSRAFWKDIRDVTPFHGTASAVWKISVAPQDAAKVLQETQSLPGGEAFMDWAGGLIWLSVEPNTDAQAPAIRAAVDRSEGGYATLIRASASLRAAVPVFQPQPVALTALTQRLKSSFDPNGILNPGRMAEAA